MCVCTFFTHAKSKDSRKVQVVLLTNKTKDDDDDDDDDDGIARQLNSAFNHNTKCSSKQEMKIEHWETLTTLHCKSW